LRGNQRVLVINIPWYMEPHTDVKVLDKNAKEKQEGASSKPELAMPAANSRTPPDN
jgi:hypothetical protein